MLWMAWQNIIYAHCGYIYIYDLPRVSSQDHMFWWEHNSEQRTIQNMGYSRPRKVSQFCGRSVLPTKKICSISNATPKSHHFYVFQLINPGLILVVEMCRVSANSRRICHLLRHDWSAHFWKSVAYLCLSKPMEPTQQQLTPVPNPNTYPPLNNRTPWHMV